MNNNPVFDSFMERLGSATKAQADSIIGEAFNQYLCDKIDDLQYGKIYFKALRIINGKK